MPFPESLGQPQRPAFVNEGARRGSTDFTRTIKITSNVLSDARSCGLEMESRAANTIIPVEREIMS